MQKPRIQISLSPEVLEGLKTIANALNRPVSKVAEEILTDSVPFLMDQNSVFKEYKEEGLSDSQLALRMLSSALQTLEKEIEPK